MEGDDDSTRKELYPLLQDESEAWGGDGKVVQRRLAK